MSEVKKDLPEREATPDEAFELGRVKGYNEAVAELEARTVPVLGEIEWGWRNDCGELRMASGEPAARTLAEKYNGTAVKRTAGQWVVVTR